MVLTPTVLLKYTPFFETLWLTLLWDFRGLGDRDEEFLTLRSLLERSLDICFGFWECFTSFDFGDWEILSDAILPANEDDDGFSGTELLGVTCIDSDRSVFDFLFSVVEFLLELEAGFDASCIMSSFLGGMIYIIE